MTRKCSLCRKRETSEKIINMDSRIGRYVRVIVLYFQGCTNQYINFYQYFVNKCLEKRLLPFIHKYHGSFNYLFWPDLASSHYSKDSLNCMDEYVNYVDKKSNPPNVAQARPIKTF